MKAVMYHYVRPVPADLPYFRYLHAADFARQLDWMRATFPPLDRDSFLRSVVEGRSRPGVVLTFDDGLADHLEHAIPAMIRRGMWGVFYVSTAMYTTGKLLDVHRIHWILGRLGGAAAMQTLQGFVKPEMLADAHVEAFQRATYKGQDNDAATELFKRTLNYFIGYEHRGALLDRLMERLLDGASERALVDRLYLKPESLRAMADAGMEIGSHGARHLSMAKLDVPAQRAEIEESFDFLEQAMGRRPRTFAYPYGGFHNFTAETERLLADAGCLYAFNVEQRDIEDRDLAERPQALPRFDCNRLPHGRAHLGATPP